MDNLESKPLAQEIPQPEQPKATKQKTESVLLQPVPPQQIPEQVKTNIDLDKKRYEADKSAALTIENDQKTKPKDPDKINRIFKKVLKISAISFGVIVSIFVLLFVLTVTNIDTAIFKITLTGVVTDRITKEPIANATVSINDSTVTTDPNGRYSIGGLNLGLANVKVSLDGYEEINEEVPINRLFLNYTTKKDFELTPKEKAILTGKFVTTQSGYNFLGDKVVVNDIEYNINSDGTFRLNDVYVGQTTFKFLSPNFKDISNTIEIKTGINQLQDITLQPAGDIVGELISYVREEIVTNITFNVENVTEAQKEIKDGNFRIKDLEVGTEYKIQVVADGYKTRDYTVNIKQGNNEFFDFRLVEEGFAVFLTEDPSTRTSQFYKSDFDCEGLEALTNFERVNIENEYFDSTQNKLFYMSDKERLRSGTTTTKAIYSIDILTKTETRLTQNFNNLGNLYPNYQANKMLSVLQQRTGSITEYKLTVTDLTGNNRVDVKTTRNQVGKIVISDDGRYLFLEERTSGQPTLMRVDINSKQERTITTGNDISLYDVSTNGNIAIYSKKNESTGFIDLFLYNFESNETRLIRENHDGQRYQFVEGNGDSLLYFAQRDGRYNLFKYTISENKDERLTNLSAGDEIVNIYQQKRFAFYITKNGLFVIDINQPKNYKRIVEGKIQYTGI